MSFNTSFEITPFGINKKSYDSHAVLRLCIHTDYNSVIESKIITLHQNTEGIFFLMGDTGDGNDPSKKILKEYPNIEYNNNRACYVWSFNKDVSKKDIYILINSSGKKLVDLTFNRDDYVIDNNEVFHKNYIICKEEQKTPPFFSIGLRQRNNRVHYNKLMS